MILREAIVSFNRKIRKKATYNEKETQNPDNRNSGGEIPMCSKNNHINECQGFKKLILMKEERDSLERSFVKDTAKQ